MKRRLLFKYSSTFYRRRQQIHADEDNALGTPGQMEMEITQEETSSDENPESDDSEHQDDIEQELHSDNSVDNIALDEIQDENITPASIGLKLRQFLPLWSTEANIPLSTLSSLLAGLTESGIPGLPKDPRTLLGTPKTVVVESMGSGEFWYNSIKTCLQHVPKFLNNCLDFTVKLDFGMDGLPLHNSTQKQFWPILLKIANIQDYPCQVVAIYFGNTKPPSALEYLSHFCHELLELIANGLVIDDINIKIQLNAFICDTPARCFVACVVLYNAYYGCLKCTVKGEYHQNEKRMSYPQLDCPLRTDHDIRNKTEPSHHQKNNEGECISSPLENLPIDLVKDIVIADSLHLLDIGVMKTMLKHWVKGSKTNNVKFFNNQVREISYWLNSNDKYRPFEIHRSLTNLDYSNWKATQCHTFMLYRGPVILKTHLARELYNHYMLLICAVFLCSSNHFIEKLDLAQDMLVDFVEEYVSLYGVHSITSNIHNLCHVVEDVKRFGALPKISAYKFENKLGMIKHLLRNGNKPLAQVIKQMAEIDKNLEFKSKTLNNVLSKEVTIDAEKPVGVAHCYKKVCLKNGVVFSSTVKNCWLLTKTDKIVKVKSIYLDVNNKVVIFGLKIRKLKDFFDYPFASSYISIYRAKEQFSEEVHIKQSEIKCKMVCVEYQEELILIPLVHTFDLF